MTIPTFPPWYRIPLALSRAELWWLSYLWLAWAYAEQRAEQFARDVWARYNTPAHRRVEALALRESPFLREVRRGA